MSPCDRGCAQIRLRSALVIFVVEDGHDLGPCLGTSWKYVAGGDVVRCDRRGRRWWQRGCRWLPVDAWDVERGLNVFYRSRSERWLLAAGGVEAVLPFAEGVCEKLIVVLGDEEDLWMGKDQRVAARQSEPAQDGVSGDCAIVIDVEELFFDRGDGGQPAKETGVARGT